MFSGGNGTLRGRDDDMSTVTEANFPCPVCLDPRKVKLTKKNKPYITCDPCGIQVFIRGPAGIAEFKRLVERGESDGLSARIQEMERRFRLTCPKCGFKFWAERRLVVTSKFDGGFKGFRCALNSCGALVPWEGKQ
jgi:DNA-directed RNA polymerase subunit RPC12/RpoP